MHQSLKMHRTAGNVHHQCDRERAVHQVQPASSLSLVEVSKIYGDFLALDHVSFEVERGEFITVLGPSGSGKTTLLRIIAGFADVTAGDVRIDDRSILSEPPHRRNVGLVFQNYALFPHMSVRDNIAFPLKMRKMNRADRDRRVAEMLDLVRLSDLGDRMPRQLSGGQQQRVALARTLSMQPSVLLLDEPLGALDKQLREQMQVEIRRIHNELGVTIFHVTHDQEEALTMSDRIAVMNKGRVAQIGRPNEIYARPTDLFVAQFIGRGNFLKAKVKSANQAEAVVALAAGPSLRVPRRSSTATLAVGDEIRCLIRPEHVMFAVAAKNAGGIEATIVDKIFVGEAIEISAALPNGERITARRTARESEGLQEGQKVNVNWDAADCYILDTHGPS
jgi:putative spermidine/putrescine transport system ATP-binding protein